MAVGDAFWETPPALKEQLETMSRHGFWRAEARGGAVLRSMNSVLAIFTGLYCELVPLGFWEIKTNEA
jgi:hypothetical protein